MNLPKSTPYTDLLKIVNIKSLEHRRYTQALILFINIYLIRGQSTSNKFFHCVATIMTSGDVVSLISLASNQSICITPIATQLHAYETIYLAKQEERPFLAFLKIFCTVLT